jgi:hypothetical protein
VQVAVNEEEFAEITVGARAYDRLFLVWHSGDVGEVEETNVSTIGPSRLSRMILDSGLSSWLLKKVS